MISLASLWLPIVLSAVIVFLASSVIHMLLPYHRSDFVGLPKEQEIMDALRPFSIPPGEYVMPHAGDMKEMGSPEFLEKTKKGPVAFMTVLPNGPFAMGSSLAMWFVYCLIVGLFAAYITSRALSGPSPEYLDVFRFVGATSFIGYCVALWQNSIWYKRSWLVTAKFTLDGLVYALLTAGTFGWLWPA